MTKQIPFQHKRGALTIEVDGLSLSACLIMPSPLRFSSPYPAVIICHGLGSRKERHIDFGAFLASQGFAALIVELRGHGESQGALDGREVADFGQWIACLRDIPEIDSGRLAIRGSSLGGNYAIHAAVRNPELKAVVAICPAPERGLVDILEQQGRPELIEGDDIYVRLAMPAYIEYLKTQNLFQAVTSLAPRPLFLIHSKGDETIPYVVSEELYQRAADPKRLLLLDGGSHSSAQHDPGVNQQVVDWLSAALK